VLPEGNSPLATLMDSYEREILSEALRRHDGNMSAAGRDLSVSPRMMLYKIRRLGIAASN
jgi:Nif-specific regulatory protein